MSLFTLHSPFSSPPGKYSDKKTSYSSGKQHAPFLNTQKNAIFIEFTRGKYFPTFKKPRKTSRLNNVREISHKIFKRRTKTEAPTIQEKSFSRKPHNPRRITHFLNLQNQKDRENALFNLWNNACPRQPATSASLHPKHPKFANREICPRNPVPNPKPEPQDPNMQNLKSAHEKQRPYTEKCRI
jgi:hypothetical protein